MSERCFVGLGANLGNAPEAVLAAIGAIGRLPATAVLRASSLYRTPAWGLTAQPDFINAVVMLDTAREPLALLEDLLAIERDAGRDRSSATRWGPRALDLDLLLYGDHTIDVPGLHVPHPHLHERAFVLVPLVEIAPDAHIPGVGPARDCAAAMESAGMQALTYGAPSA
ncbi:2-amino-4-hydroxy-6-hydroxymethyldihydropteridine diphosphokinase [Cognatilysobacter bugurensis]|uniref:2-amino-4-hydroxy-6-hydroxymethyldihydropteridine pyrophosphokinase n=1 Tax=Cognatilysobacter bugurensis TaxID=543356 RepID=A0A918SWN5_9GAMM|nr:2-amino-4-hydroxy-6-hydroxymethyldihydropteridine diphosphokinase [Lysobacter bugurensis]GHA74538.1 2-amino-4-hydroxy-6-hydroxymethyldihydropteridine diphosphokinase [Lysobacter bugurensis]